MITGNQFDNAFDCQKVFKAMMNALAQPGKVFPFAGSAAKIPTGQPLGPIYDYVHRLLDFDLAEETEQELQERCRQFEEQIVQSEEPQVLSDTAPRVLDLLREEGLIAAMEPDDSEPCDITMEKLPPLRG